MIFVQAGQKISQKVGQGAVIQHTKNIIILETAKLLLKK